MKKYSMFFLALILGGTLCTQNFDSTFTNNTSNPVRIFIKYGEQCFDPQNNNYLFGGKGEDREYVIWAGQKQPVKFETMAERLTDKNCTQALSIKVFINDKQVLISNLTQGGNYQITQENGLYVVKALTSSDTNDDLATVSDDENEDEDSDEY